MAFLASLLQNHWAYALVLLVSLPGLCVLDRKYSLVLFTARTSFSRRSPRALATYSTLAVLLTLFVAWDILGIVLGIFRTNTTYTVGLNLFTPNLPLEEIGFLTLLIYVTLLVYQAAARYVARSTSS